MFEAMTKRVIKNILQQLKDITSESKTWESLIKYMSFFGNQQNHQNTMCTACLFFLNEHSALLKQLDLKILYYTQYKRNTPFWLPLQYQRKKI